MGILANAHRGWVVGGHLMCGRSVSKLKEVVPKTRPMDRLKGSIADMISPDTLELIYESRPPHVTS